MSPTEARFFRLAAQRVASLEPALRADLLRAFQIIRDGLSAADWEAIANGGAIPPDVLDRAFLPFRRELRTAIERGFDFAVRDLPRGGKIDGVPAVAFDHLDPYVIAAIRGLETDALDTLKAEIRDTVRQAIERGLTAGQSPATIARGLRDVIGLAPNQADAVANFRGMLEVGDREALTRALRDRRFDGTLTRAFAGDGLTGAQIDTMTEAYQRKFVAFNANVNAKTHTFDAYKQGQALAWSDAKDAGVIPDGYELVKTWVHFDAQPDPRPEHVAMSGETVPAGQDYSNGDSYAGEQDPWNCRCLDRFSLQRAA